MNDKELYEKVKENKYYVKRGYFGDKGITYISFCKGLLFRVFTDICVYKKVDGKEIWLNK